MRNRLIKFGAVLAGMLSVALLAPLAWAWACTSLATVDLKPAAGVTGAEIAGVGYGFDTGAVGPGPASVEPVEVHWNSTSGPLLARVAPSSDGSIHFSFKAPAGAPAYYTVIATQNDATGQPVAGTPARASFALNNPPRQAVSGAELAGSVDRETAGHGAPSAIVHDRCPPLHRRALAAVTCLVSLPPARPVRNSAWPSWAWVPLWP